MEAGSDSRRPPSRAPPPTLQERQSRPSRGGALELLNVFADKGPPSQTYGFPSGHVWMWELDHKEGWGLKNWCFWAVMLEKTLESPLDCKEIQPVNPKGNQSWIFIGRTDAEAETPILWHLVWRTDSLEKTLMLGKIESRRRRGWQRMRQLDGITNWMDTSLSKIRELVIGNLGVLQSVESKRVGQYWMTELNWAELVLTLHMCCIISCFSCVRLQPYGP